MSNFDREFTPKTTLAKALWDIRQRAIRNGQTLKSSKELQQELAEYRGFIDEKDTEQ